MRTMNTRLMGLLLRRPLLSGVVASTAVICLGLAIAAPGMHLGRDAAVLEEAPFSFEQAAASNGAVDPRPVADIALTDQDGRRVRLREQEGKVVVVNFITTRCSGVCMRATRDLRALHESLGDRMGREVVFFSIGLDSEWDTAAAMREFAERHGAKLDGWAFLSGSPEELEAAREALGAVAARTAAQAGGEPSIEHSATAYVVDRRGVLRKQLPPGLLSVAGFQAIEETLAARG